MGEIPEKSPWGIPKRITGRDNVIFSSETLIETVGEKNEKKVQKNLKHTLGTGTGWNLSRKPRQTPSEIPKRNIPAKIPETFP